MWPPYFELFKFVYNKTLLERLSSKNYGFSDICLLEKSKTTIHAKLAHFFKIHTFFQYSKTY